MATRKVLKVDVKKRGNKMQEEKKDQVFDAVLDGPDELLGYVILGANTSIPGEEVYNTDNLWQDGHQSEKLIDNTHACWGLFPKVNK